MITIEDIKRMKLPHLTTDQIRRFTNAENTCKIAKTDWSKNYWFNVWKTLCQKFGRMDLYHKDLH